MATCEHCGERILPGRTVTNRRTGEDTQTWIHAQGGTTFCLAETVAAPNALGVET